MARRTLAGQMAGDISTSGVAAGAVAACRVNHTGRPVCATYCSGRGLDIGTGTAAVILSNSSRPWWSPKRVYRKLSFCVPWCIHGVCTMGASVTVASHTGARTQQIHLVRSVDFADLVTAHARALPYAEIFDSIRRKTNPASPRSHSGEGPLTAPCVSVVK